MHFSFFGAAPDTGNLGVSALCYATMHNFLTEDPATTFTVFDHGRGSSVQQIDLGSKIPMSFQRQGAMLSRRYYRPESYRVVQISGILGGLGNPVINAIKKSKAVFDVSGGDSFTDLYGSKRFQSVILPKQIVLQQRVPLVLLPQTYGPFSDKSNEQKASEIVKKAHCAWARDARSFDVLKELLGPSFDQARHKCGVDVAFGLPLAKPKRLSLQMDALLNSGKDKVGINVSGLIYNDPAKAKEQFAFKANYRAAVQGLVQQFLDQTDCTIFLVPHVVTPTGHYESDTDACSHVFRQLNKEDRNRVIIVPEYDNPCEIKWLISKLTWFCGTRMHATIAALSTGVPVSAISYSPKTLGVFETCSQGGHVADPQVLGEDDLVQALWNSWETRADATEQLAEQLPKIKNQIYVQTCSILNSFVS